MSDCEICRGAGRIRLPVYRQAIAFSAGGSVALDETSREYPCPECSGTVSEQRLVVVTEHSDAPALYDPDFLNVTAAQIARVVAVEILKKGLIRIERGKEDEARQRFTVRATVGVVSPKAVTTLQERIAERQDEIAREVVSVGLRRVAVWGSYYGDTHIRKENVGDEMRAALKEVLERPKEWRELAYAGGEQGIAAGDEPLPSPPRLG